MSAFLAAALLAVTLWSAPAAATDIINQDRRAYRIRVQGEGKLSISFYNLRGGGSISGVCGYTFCTFQIKGSRATATRNGRLTIRNGRFSN